MDIGLATGKDETFVTTGKAEGEKAGQAGAGDGVMREGMVTVVMTRRGGPKPLVWFGGVLFYGAGEFGRTCAP